MLSLAEDRALNIAYLAVATMVVASLGLHEALPALHFIAKPLIMIVLLGWYWRQTSGNFARNKVAMVLSMAFSWGGDVLLMFPGPAFFIGGLASFLLAHVGYCYAFLATDPRLTEDEPVLRRKPRILLPFIAFYAAMLATLWPSLGDMKAPVAVYATVITTMAALALNRWKRVPHESFGPVFGGALLFVLSDSLLAFNRFLTPIPAGHFWVLVTYMAAQYLIVTGYARMQVTRV